MNLAKISSDGQITVPVEIRRFLKLRGGDKILFSQCENGGVVIYNASATALLKAQKSFAGAAKDFGVANEDDVQRLIDEIRYGKEENPCG
jgi:AbrB family looped-hinge helix DNA binding protein